MMIEALRFQQTSPKFIAPPISAGLPKGLVLQLWIRRTGDLERTPIVELAGVNSRIVLGTGNRFDVLSLSLIADGKTTEISVPGALPIARWVQVRATVASDGTAELHVLGMKLAQGKLPSPGSETRTLMIGGLIGELTQLQVWKSSSPTLLSYDAPKDLNAGNLWAYYPLSAIEWDAANKQSVVEDIGPHHRHAVMQGSTNAATRVVHDEALDRRQAAHLRFVSNDRSLKLGPLTGLSGRLTLEAWVCPVGDSPTPVVLVAGTEARLVLVAGGSDGEVALLSIDNSKRVDVVTRSTGLAQPNQWSHVAVTLEVTKAKYMTVTVPQLNVGVFQQGQLRKRETFTQTHAGAMRLASLVSQPLIPLVALGAPAPGYMEFFRGGMAEVRIWRGAAQERVEALWLARARGDEDELIACYRLDTDPDEHLVDISSRRGFTAVPSGISLEREQCPPLAATSGALAFRVQVRGKLLSDQVPLSSTSATTKNLWQVTDATTGETTTAAAKSEARSIFHVTIDITSRSGNSPLGRMLDVRLDQPLTMLEIKGSQLVQTPWAANQTHQILLPASGRVWLRFDAKQLACPTLRLRVSGTPGSVWTVVRPDESAQKRLRKVTAESLKKPADGRRSPLPVEASDADAQALADALTRLGTQLVRQPSASSNPSTSGASSKLFGPVEDWVVEDVGDVAEDTWEATSGAAISGGTTFIALGQEVLEGATTIAKSAGNLLVCGTQQLELLTAKCTKVGAWVGTQALTTAIRRADRLAFVGAQSWGDTARWVEAIGTSIVDGAEVAWRVIVSGVDDALAAVTSLVQRIGAMIQEWIDYLAWLFMWDDFVDASDEAYAFFQETMRGVGQQIAGLDGIKHQLTDALRETVEDAIGKRSLADVFGIDAEAVSPAIEQLEYVQEQVQQLLESTDLSWVSSRLGEDTGLGPSEAVSTQSSELLRLQPFCDPSDVLGFLDTPISELLASNQQLANGSSSLFDAVFDPIAAASTELLEQLDTAMFSRLSVPYLTEVIENVVLCGRTLSIARVMALMAAIPVVLAEKSSSGQSRTLIMSRSTSETTEVSQAEQDRLDADRRTRWALWGVMAAGLLNTIVVVCKSAVEKRSQNESTAKFSSFFQMTSGSLGVFRGLILVGRIPAFPLSTRIYASINACAEMTAGLCTAYFGMQGLKKIGPTETRKDWSMVEAVLQGMLGATVIASSAIALKTGEFDDERSKTAFSLRCSSWVVSLFVRMFEKLDDRDASGRLKYVTMGLAGIQVVIEVGEAIYGNVVETDAQT